VQKDVASSNHAWAEVAKKKGARQVDSLSKLLSETVARAKHGWQVILLPLVSLGFTCMETRVTKGKAICDALRAVGSDLLQQLFEKHES
ncbi:hypothetical protein, partial [Vibrio cholerae]|uniref:hypothetical protein n=1 Tax=Vibrio cholerae TaxID=666 RepID=UPI001F285976